MFGAGQLQEWPIRRVGAVLKEARVKSHEQERLGRFVRGQLSGVAHDDEARARPGCVGLRTVGHEPHDELRIPVRGKRIRVVDALACTLQRNGGNARDDTGRSGDVAAHGVQAMKS